MTQTRGQRLFQKIVENHVGDKVIPGAAAWNLYDTYGFPIDLTSLISILIISAHVQYLRTEIMAEERGFTIDRAGYEAAKAESIAKSQADSKAVGVQVDLDVHAISELKLLGVPQTEERYRNRRFLPHLALNTLQQPQVQLHAL